MFKCIVEYQLSILIGTSIKASMDDNDKNQIMMLKLHYMY